MDRDAGRGDQRPQSDPGPRRYHGDLNVVLRLKPAQRSMSFGVSPFLASRPPTGDLFGPAGL